MVAISTNASPGGWFNLPNWDDVISVPESFMAAVLTWCCFMPVKLICDISIGGSTWMTPAFYGL